MACSVIDPPRDYGEIVTGLPDDLTWADPSAGELDFVHVFVREAEGLGDRLRGLRSMIARDGMIWVSWPKKASGVATDVTEELIRQAALAEGLVDVKVCAVDDVWSGLKLVIRRADRL